jgi:hypothetical protein
METNTETTTAPIICARCGDGCKRAEGSISTGYAVTDNDDRICYNCCAKDDAAYMTEHGKWTGYFTFKEIPLSPNHGPQMRLDHGNRYEFVCREYTITNWPGSLSFTCLHNIRVSKTNWGDTRHDFWFWGPDGHKWHGKQIGDFNQIAHCRRTKERRTENWDLYTYDVWGNARDGFDVNNVFRSCSVQLPPDATDNQILRAVGASRCEIDYSQCETETIYIRVKRNGKPAGELRRREGEPLEKGPVWFIQK